MNYAAIRNYDIGNGDGVRVSLFVSGCQFHCHNCFNPDQQSFHYGKPYTCDTQREIIGLVRQPMISGLSILGGDPMWQDEDGLAQLCVLCDRVHDLHKSVWIWSGFTYEQLMDHSTSPVWRRLLLKRADVLIDGLFRQELADPALVWRGSSNQRVIDMRRTPWGAAHPTLLPVRY